MFWKEAAAQTIALIYYFAMAEADLKKHCVPLVFAAAGPFAFCLVRIFLLEPQIKDMLLGLIPGALLLIISKLSRQAIGYGDGIMLISSGILTGLFGAVFMLLVSMLLASAVSIVLMMIKKGKGKTQLPFIPFMFGAYVVMLAL